MIYIKENYITNTCVAEFKDMDGSISKMISDIDKTCYGDLLCDEDNAIIDIIDEESEVSGEILEESQYDLTNCSVI